MGLFSTLSKRSTPDLIVLGLAVTVAVIILGTMITVGVAAALGNTGHLDSAADWIVKMCNTIVGSVFGYLAGRDPNSWGSGPSIAPTDEPPEGS